MEAAVYRGEHEVARVETDGEDVQRGAIPFPCLDCKGTGTWPGHPVEPKPCVPCSTRGEVLASL